MSDFDSRATILGTTIKPEWSEDVRITWEKAHAKIRQELQIEFGAHNFQGKLRNFLALGPAPISIVSYHNRLFHEARSAFVHGFYYPALTAACALGERMLNHMILDLRSDYATTLEFKKVDGKEAFHKWQPAMNYLQSWGVIDATVKQEFEELRKRRQTALHFDAKLYSALREEALGAVKSIQAIVSTQFGAHGPNRWFIPSAGGHTFLRKESENEPFVRRYYLPQCPKVGYLFAMAHRDGGEGGQQWLYFDFSSYPDGPLTDEEFVQRYTARKPDDCAATSLPQSPEIVVQYVHYGQSLRPSP